MTWAPKTSSLEMDSIQSDSSNNNGDDEERKSEERDKLLEKPTPSLYRERLGEGAGEEEDDEDDEESGAARAVKQIRLSPQATSAPPLNYADESPSAAGDKEPAQLVRVLPSDLNGLESTCVLLSLSFWGCFFNMVTAVLAFPVDLIPFFGSSTSLSEEWSKIVYGFECNVKLVSSCSLTWLFSLLFNSGFVLGYIAGALINKTSPAFSILSLILTTPVVILFWIVAGAVSPAMSQLANENATPLWSVIPATLLAIVGIGMYRVWEHQEDKRLAKKLENKIIL